MSSPSTQSVSIYTEHTEHFDVNPPLRPASTAPTTEPALLSMRPPPGMSDSVPGLSEIGSARPDSQPDGHVMETLEAHVSGKEPEQPDTFSSDASPLADPIIEHGDLMAAESLALISLTDRMVTAMSLVLQLRIARLNATIIRTPSRATTALDNIGRTEERESTGPFIRIIEPTVSTLRTRYRDVEVQTDNVAEESEMRLRGQRLDRRRRNARIPSFVHNNI